MSEALKTGSGQGTRIAFVLPTKNEEATISALILELKKLCAQQSWHGEIFVVDDSSDATASIARGLDVTVLSGGGAGLGQAMFVGLAAVKSREKEREYEWVASLDTDGQVEVGEIPYFLEMAKSGEADIVLSSRFLAKNSFEYPYPFINWLGNRMLVRYLRIATGLPITDSHGGLRLMRTKTISHLMLMARHTYVQETIVQWARRKYRILELPGKWRERKAGKSRVLSSILRYAIRTAPALFYHIHLHYWLWAFAGALLAGAALLEILPMYIALPLAAAAVGAGYGISRLPRAALRI